MLHDGPDFTGTRVSRLDPTVDVDWGAGAPVTGFGSDTFSVRWSGALVPRYTQTYTFAMTSDDGVRLWVGGRLVVDAWTPHAVRTDTGTVALNAGVPTPVVLEYFEGDRQRAGAAALVECVPGVRGRATGPAAARRTRSTCSPRAGPCRSATSPTPARCSAAAAG